MQVIERIKINDILDCSGAKIILVFYGYSETENKNYFIKHGIGANYTINFALMRNDNVWKYLVLNKSGAGLDITQAFPMEQYGKTIKVYYKEEWYNKYLVIILTIPSLCN